MSLLTMIQRATEELGILKPLTVVGNADTQVLQLLALAKTEGEELTRRGDWEFLIEEFSIVTLAAESQGKIRTLLPGYDSIVNNTMWNRNTTTIVFGPRSKRDWAAEQARGITGPFTTFRMRGGNLIFSPVPSAGETVTGEYKTKLYCEKLSNGAGQSEWLKDDDIGRLDEDLMRLGLIWRWKRKKGFDYSEEFNTYERAVVDALAKDGGKRILNMGSNPSFGPAIAIPDGDFTV